MSTPSNRQFKYYDFVLASYVCIAVCANVIGPSKLTTVPLGIHLPLFGDDITFLAGVLFFPISYIFGDVLTEVYGYARSRRMIWAGFAALAFATVMAQIIISMPPNPDEPFNL